MDKIREVLDQYGIQPVALAQITENVYRVSDGNFTYALKKSYLSEVQIKRLRSTYDLALQFQLSSVIPIYMTKDNILIVNQGDHQYYLMPWIEKNMRSIENVYTQIGCVHAQSRQIKAFEADKIIQTFKVYEKEIADMMEELTGVMRQFEAKRFMSPFELLVCTSFRDIRQVLSVLSNRIKTFNWDLKEEKTWTESVCHGNLSARNIVGMDPIYFTGWERAGINHPTTDLIVLYDNDMKDNYFNVEKFTGSFENYMKENELTKLEICYLGIQLLNPSKFMNCIYKYYRQNPVGTMLEQTINLSNQHQRLLFGLKFSKFLEENYETIPLEDL